MAICSVTYRKYGLPSILLLLASSGVWAQTLPPGAELTLPQAFTAAWQRQPEAQSLASRQDAAAAHRQVADSWTPEPASLELSSKSDRVTSNHGNSEFEAGVALPLWLPGERARSRALADAQVRSNASRLLAAQLRTAASVRESYWQWQRSRGEHALALERLANAQQLAADVAKRVKAGDLARADQHQADGVEATASAQLAEAASALAGASQQLRALTGAAPSAALDAPLVTEPLPDVSVDGAVLAAYHPAVAELVDQTEVARRASDLARVQSRGNPELTLAVARARGVDSEPYQQSFTLGIRIPFGSDNRQRSRLSTVQAELIEAETLWRLEQERLLAERDGARVRFESAQAQLKAAEKRAQLARESRSFFLKSYQMGETDLPTRLRIELESIEAQRQASRARIDLAAAVSSLRQTLGLLPE